MSARGGEKQPERLRGTSRHSRPGVRGSHTGEAGRTELDNTFLFFDTKKRNLTRIKNEPFSRASPCRDRFHPGPVTPSGRSGPARTYPTSSSPGRRFPRGHLARRRDTVSMNGLDLRAGWCLSRVPPPHPSSRSGSRLNFCCSCGRKAKRRSDWSKVCNQKLP